MTTPPITPAPEGWNKTVSDLFAEVKSGLRSSLGSPEIEWAIDYERSLLPAGTRFPQKGDVYVANEAIPVTLFVSWHSPVTTDVKFSLPVGCKVRVESECTDRPITVHALPVDYKAVEKAALSFWTRIRPDYGGYHLALSTRELNSVFSLVRVEA